MFETWTLAVFSDTNSASPICRLVWPAATRDRTSASRGVRPRLIDRAVARTRPRPAASTLSRVRRDTARCRPAGTRRRAGRRVGAPPAAPRPLVRLRRRRPRLRPRERGPSPARTDRRGAPSARAASAQASGIGVAETGDRGRGMGEMGGRCRTPPRHRVRRGHDGTRRTIRSRRRAAGGVGVERLASGACVERELDLGDDREHDEPRPPHCTGAHSRAEARSAIAAASAQSPSASVHSAAARSRNAPMKRIDRVAPPPRASNARARSRSPRRGASIAPASARRISPSGKASAPSLRIEHRLGLRPPAEPEQSLGGECVEVSAEAAVESRQPRVGGRVEHLVDRILVPTGVEEGDAEVEHGERLASARSGPRRPPRGRAPHRGAGRRRGQRRCRARAAPSPTPAGRPRRPPAARTRAALALRRRRSGRA